MFVWMLIGNLVISGLGIISCILVWFILWNCVLDMFFCNVSRCFNGIWFVLLMICCYWLWYVVFVVSIWSWFCGKFGLWYVFCEGNRKFGCLFGFDCGLCWKFIFLWNCFLIRIFFVCSFREWLECVLCCCSMVCVFEMKLFKVVNLVWIVGSLIVFFMLWKILNLYFCCCRRCLLGGVLCLGWSFMVLCMIFVLVGNCVSYVVGILVGLS